MAILGPNGCGKSTLILTITLPDLSHRAAGDEGAYLWPGALGSDPAAQTLWRGRLGCIRPELPGERTAVTTGLDAVIAGFFSASTLWPNLHVTDEMRERAVEALERIEALHWRNNLWAKCRLVKSAAS